MKIVLKVIRANHFTNRLVRGALKSLNKLISTAIDKWRLAGVIDLDYLGVRFKILTKTDDAIANRIYYGQRWEDAEAKVFLAIAKMSRVILDVGANSGVYSIIAGAVNLNAKVYSFEPNPVNFKRLVENVSLNSLKNVIPVQLAVGNSEKDVKFSVQDESKLTETSSVVSNFANSFAQGKMKEINVKQTTLDTFIKKHHIKPDFIKIDVEYYEKEVLLGASELLKKHEPLVMCEVLVYDVIKSLYPKLSGNLDPDHSYFIERYFKNLGYFFYLISNEGLMRVETLHGDPDGKNFLFSTRKSSDIFLPFDEIKEIL